MYSRCSSRRWRRSSTSLVRSSISLRVTRRSRLRHSCTATTVPPIPVSRTAMPVEASSTDTLTASLCAPSDEVNQRADQHAEDLRLDAHQRLGIGLGVDEFDDHDADGPEDQDEADDPHDRQDHQVDGRAIAETHNTSQPKLTAASPTATTAAYSALAWKAITAPSRNTMRATRNMTS